MSISGEDEERKMKWRVVNLDNLPQNIILSDTALQTSPFCGDEKSTMELNLAYRIEPHLEWAALDKYTHCSASEEVYANGDYVFIRPAKGKFNADAEAVEKELSFHDFWVAKILEFRAKDESHVYARVYWMYWPDDLPKLRDCGETKKGRRSYHGKYELIASSHMEIVSVCTFAGVAAVADWHQESDDVSQTGLYWRQGYDYRTSKLSVLNKYCSCDRYYNPDKIILSCSSLDCGVWFHHECLVDDILTKKCKSSNVCIEALQGTIVNKRKRKGKGRPKKVPKVKPPYLGIYSAEIVSGEGDDAPQAEITDLRVDVDHEMRKWKEDIMCPECSTKIE